MFKTLQLIPTYVSLSIKRSSEYKLSWYVFIFNQAFILFTWILFWNLLLARIGTFGPWTLEHMVLLVGFSSLSLAIWFTFIGIWRFPQEVITGNLNMHLIRPVHPLLHFVFLRLGTNVIPRVLTSVALIAYALFAFDFSWTWYSLLIALAVCVIGFLASYLPFVLVILLTFWVGRAEILRDLLLELFPFYNYPLTLFPFPFLVFFTLIIPFIFAGTFPVLILTEFTLRQSLFVLGALVLIIAIQLMIFTIIWKRGLRRYESFGG